MKTKIFTNARGLMMLILATMISTNVWANETDELTYTSFFSACSSSGANTDGAYTGFSNVSGANSDAVYAGQLFKHGNGPANCHSYIQMRSKNSNSGIITTTSGGKAVSVSVSWNSETGASGTLNVYGSNSAYSAASDLYADATDGDLIGTIVYGTSTSLDIDDDYEFIGLRSNSGALYFDDISIEWSTKSLSSIALKTSATKTAYVAGEDFAAAGMVITATYSDASTEDIDYDSNSAKFSFSPSTSLTEGTTSVTVTYGGKTCTQTIAVYAVTVQAKDENGDAIAAGGPGAPSRTGASISPAADAGNYKFWKWEISGASLGSAATTKSNTITNPTGAVTVTAKYYLPRTVTWKVNGDTWTPSENSGTDGTSEVKRETTWSALTLPTDPTTSDGCGNKFLGWTPEPIEGSLDKTDDADAISTLESTGLLNSGNKSSKSASTYKIMNNTTFHAVFADYAE